ncbi:MAG: hypothetical protein AAFO95_01005 [Cyanobacteria bacterium J06600_6]
MQLIPQNILVYQPVRIGLVYLSWAIRCLPYFAIALLVNQILRQNIGRWFYSRATAATLLVICILANIFAEQTLPQAVSEILIAYSLLLFGIAISKYLPNNDYIANLGACSFGIYLIHPFIKSAVDILLAEFFPQITKSVSIFSMSVYAISSFLISWGFISLMQRQKFIARYI